MNCLQCKEKLKRIIYKGIELDICPRCGGVWFDAEELGRVMKTLETSSAQVLKEFIPAKLKVTTVVSKNCPRCQTSLNEFNYAYNSNTYLDRCPKCGGIWADSGEIQQLADYKIKAKEKEEMDRNFLKSFQEHERELAMWRDIRDLGSGLSRSGFRAMFLPKIILPLSDINPVRIFPKVTFSIIGLNILIFFGMLIFVKDISGFFQQFGLIPVRVLGKEGLFTPISSMFLHAGFLHLFFNMFFFWIFGDNIEEWLGAARFIVFYLIIGLLAGGAYILTYTNSAIPCVGASGAISGIMGGYFILFPQARIRMFCIDRVIALPAFFYLGSWILLQTIWATIYRSSGVSDIAWTAHIAGFLGGLIIMLFLKKRVRTRR